VPPDQSAYRRAFDRARQAFRDGNSYLLNLTAASRVASDLDLRTLFWLARAPYRLWMDGFLVFSPEAFVRIGDGMIRSFPMKGSLRCPADAGAAGRRTLLDDPKEQAEHVTVVDLLRNDLGMVSSRVEVPRFRYLEEIPLGAEVLLQTSSEIAGRLEAGWPDRLGSLLAALLPAGSVTGAPKPSTCRVIAEAEALLGHRRGWYTGVFGVFTGEAVDSAVMIRCVGEDEGPPPSAGTDGASFSARFRGWFHSGGGLTWDSDPELEYRELVQKVAFPAQPCLLETIRVQDGCLVNPSGHARRMAASAPLAWGQSLGFDPEAVIRAAFAQAAAALPGRGTGGAEAARALDGRWRFRLEYGPLGAVAAGLEPYRLRRPACLYLAETGGLDYACKYADRSGLDRLRTNAAAVLALPGTGGAGRAPAPPADWDLLLCREGRLLEASYAALVCELDGAGGGGAFLATPHAPLLPSTRLAAYAGREGGGFIRGMPLCLADLPRIRRIWLVNALIDLTDGVEIPEIRDPAQGGNLVWTAGNSLQEKP
jgi:para-aminobenzoate synthetase component 1